MNSGIFVDFASGSLNKYTEELCGDKVEFYNKDSDFIVVLSDGLGSGVKANILATLTAKIAVTMLRDGLLIEEVVDTILKTLPVCSIRNVAYSTFTIIKIAKDGMAYIAEFDNPSVFFMRNNAIKKLDWIYKEINGQKIRETKFKLQEKDIIVSVSDGAIYAGTGPTLNLDWRWDDIARYLKRFTNNDMSARSVANELLGVCDQLYMQKPQDDTTVAVIKITKSQKAVLFSGPPIDKDMDKLIVEKIMNTKGKKIVCGGSAGNIVARELGRDIKTNFRIVDKEVPPMGYLEGIDLLTEGVLTIRKATEKLKMLKSSTDLKILDGEDGASRLAKMLYEDCTHIKMLVGRAINPAHQNPDFPRELNIKVYVLNSLKDVLVDLGKIVEIEYY